MSEQTFQTFDEMARVLVQHMRRTRRRLAWRLDYYRLRWCCEDLDGQECYTVAHTTLLHDQTFRRYVFLCAGGPGRVTDRVLDLLYQQALLPEPVKEDRYAAVEEDWL